MDDHPLAPIFTELGMQLLTKLLIPVRRWWLGVDAWTELFECGLGGHPWWHFREDEAGRLVLIQPTTPGPIPTAAPPSAAAPRRAPVRAPDATGVSVTLPSGRRTTPISSYDPAVHEPLTVALDLLVYLLDHHEPALVARRTPGPPILRSKRSLSLLARDWGHQSGVGERRADRAIALLGEHGVLGRVVVGARSAYQMPSDALARFERTFGFTVS
jgi:hypothetical protein